MLFEILNKHYQYHFSGAVNIIQLNGQNIGTIFLKNGRIIHSKTNNYANEQALIYLIYLVFHEPKNYKIMSEAGDHFFLATETIGDLKSILKKFKKFHDEILQIKKLGYNFFSNYQLSPDQTTSRNTLSTIDFQVLSEIIERKNVSRLLYENQLAETDLFFSIQNLMDKGIIKQQEEA
ncbi:MAG: hypothetical protein A2381_12075 [Bdellovibrionales bacterium RIFOXYB1_FULL_37_110]|nr:MAG: hypothetical protein A2181_01795 [Bdellovibrionales bacterium RIFOXYA1_FULL_38_20]OFZ52234.1 MAG: hypothetical protein A2417_05915 [Bdellovibrionales bacterium RIFOXYC1_FULL_37_79]OFZ57221.1 MAG: hypothetical protein A2381_12075 [Bdellovibrionales bacterium RIFOXYB1_FULL_37_110]OFZ65223.1 MAG: hypothetical protein A2577_04510 [Bdellovibrionales bacterium RIFOXYD1_FULL_36_51]